MHNVQDVQEAHNPSATRLYTESEIGSPSTHATPDMPVRHGSFSFASLPPREMLQSIRQQSLGLDSDATEEDPVYVRAPELVAHEERMKAYEEPSPQPHAISPPFEAANIQPPIAPADPSVRRTRSMTQKEQEEHEEQRIAELRRSLGVTDDTSHPLDTTVTHPTNHIVAEEEHGVSRTPTQDKQHEQDIDVAMQDEEQAIADADAAQDDERVQAKSDEQAADDACREHSEEASQDEQSAEQLAEESSHTQQATNAATQDTTAERSRLRAPRNLGRPVRPTATGTMIKIKSLAQQRPVNTAPVAAHNNQDTKRVRPQPPAQAARPAPKQPPSAPKSFAAAQRKKEQDERAAERDAAVKRQQKERRDAKHEELRTKKREEQEAAEREARRKSNEFAEKHLKQLDEVPVFRANLETRQEREEREAAEKKRENREKIINRQNALQGRVYGSSSYRPLTAMDLNQPARPASRLEMHDHDSDPNIETASTENAPQRSVHEQVTRPSARPTTIQRPLKRKSQQQEAALPPYPSSLHRAPLRGSALQRPGSIFQSTNQGTASTINAFPAPPTRAPDMRQYATQRPPMANEMPSQQTRAQPQQAPAQLQQPQTASSAARPQPHPNRTRLIQAVVESSPAESNVSLPEIHTDSSEDSDRQSLASWASPRHIFQTLTAQEMFDTDRIFGPIRRVAIDDVFGTMPAEKRRRLNLRTSSANWVRTGDALTQVEVIEDRAGREAISRAGGWVYTASDVHTVEESNFNTIINNNNTRNMKY